MVAPARGPRATSPRVYDNLTLFWVSYRPPALGSFAMYCVSALHVPRVAYITWYAFRVKISQGNGITLRATLVRG